MKTIYLIIIASILRISYTPLRAQEIHWPTNNEAIKIAISDFIKTSMFHRKDSVFSVSYKDAFYRMISERIDERNSKWVRGQLYDEVVTVSIIGDEYKFSLTTYIKPGIKGMLPSRFIEIEGKLFYWDDDDHPLTQETVDVLHKYGRLRDDPDGLLYLDNPTNDSKKGMHYYFCKQDLANYKKVKIAIGIGYYDMPKLRCKP